MKKTVKDIFAHTSVSMNARGIKYIETAMELLNDNEWKEGKITCLYAEIGKRNSISKAQAEKCMRYAFKSACDEHDKEVNEYFDTLNRTTGNLLFRMNYLLNKEEKNETKITIS